MDDDKRFTLLTYRSKEEFNRFYAEKIAENKLVIPYLFNKTLGDLSIAEERKIYIDITPLIYNCRLEKANISGLVTNTYDYEGEKEFIVKSDLANDALEFFCNFFAGAEAIYPEKQEEIKSKTFEDVKKQIIFNKTLYTYEDKNQCFQIESFLESKNSALYNFSNSKYDDADIDILSTDENFTIDISIIGHAIEKEPSILPYFSIFLEKYSRANFIIKEDLKDKILNSSYFFFKKAECVDQLFSEIDFVKIETPSSNTKTILSLKSTILEESKKENVFKSIDENLFGQHEFKKSFKTKIQSFVLKNRIGRNKVFSVFLLGGSGLGKTEVARIINKSLEPNFERIVRINFGNYSSEHSLSSLIGSPRGFYGSEEGELILKMKKAHGGVLLCDEFEKAHKNVILFFLDLLENGNFSDSLGNEWDLNGYIIIFTSNVSENDFQKLPSEFKSRLDLVHQFGIVTGEDKINYIKFVVDNLKDDIVNAGLEFPNSENLNVQKFIKIEDLRKVKREIEDEILGNITSQTNPTSPAYTDKP